RRRGDGIVQQMADSPRKPPAIPGDLAGALVATEVERQLGPADPALPFLDHRTNERHELDFLHRQRQEAGFALRKVEDAFDLLAKTRGRVENRLDVFMA